MSNAIFDARQELGLTQRQMAAAMGVDRSTVTRWECGTTAISEMASRLVGMLLADFRQRRARPTGETICSFDSPDIRIHADQPSPSNTSPREPEPSGSRVADESAKHLLAETVEASQ